MCIFSKLPYWKHLSLRHNLDVMHIEKNICYVLLSTLTNIADKTKDNKKARVDLKEINIQEDLHIHRREHDDKEVMQPAMLWMNKKESFTSCRLLKSVKVCYSSNISRCISIKERNIN